MWLKYDNLSVIICASNENLGLIFLIIHLLVFLAIHGIPRRLHQNQSSFIWSSSYLTLVPFPPPFFFTGILYYLYSLTFIIRLCRFFASSTYKLQLYFPKYWLKNNHLEVILNCHIIWLYIIIWYYHICLYHWRLIMILQTSHWGYFVNLICSAFQWP